MFGCKPQNANPNAPVPEPQPQISNAIQTTIRCANINIRVGWWNKYCQCKTWTTRLITIVANWKVDQILGPHPPMQCRLAIFIPCAIHSRILGVNIVLGVRGSLQNAADKTVTTTPVFSTGNIYSIHRNRNMPTRSRSSKRWMLVVMNNIVDVVMAS